MGKKKTAASSQGNGFTTVGKANKEEEKPTEKKPEVPKGFDSSKKPKAWGGDDGFETVGTKKEKEAAKKKAQAKKQAEAAATASAMMKREVPLHKEQVRGVLAKMAEIRDDTGTLITHKAAPFPGNPSSLVIEGTELGTLRAEAAVLKLNKEVKHEEAIPMSRNGEPMVGVIIGPQGKTMEKLREISKDAKIQLPEEGGRYVTIYGPPRAVQMVAAAIRQLSGANVDASQVQLQSEDIQVVRKVPKDSRGKPMHWLLIGKQGATARRIREEAGAELIVPPPHSPSDEYTLRGSLEACERAATIIAEILADEGQTFSMEEAVAAPAAPAGPVSWVTKDGGLHVPSKSGAKTAVAPRLLKKGDAPAPPKPTVIAAPVAAKAVIPVEEVGEPWMVDLPLPQSAYSNKVKKEMTECAQEMGVKISIEGNDSFRLDGLYTRVMFAERAICKLIGMAKAEVPIPKARSGDPMVGLVIGPGGKTIMAIREASGAAFVLLPDDGAGLDPEMVTIFGTPAEVDHAVEVVRNTLRINDEAKRMATGSLDPNVMQVEGVVPMDRQGNALIPILIGTGGKNVRWIREESDGCEIDIPRSREQGAEVKYTLRGTESQIKAAQACIRMLFEEVDNYSPEEAAMAPAPRPQGVVIGPKV